MPANDPQFVIYIVVDNPKKGFYGAAVAAPVFAKVASFALRQASIPPVLITEQNIIAPQNADAPVVVTPAEPSDLVPNFVGLSLRDALKRIHGSTLELSPQGHGRVARSVPPGGEKLPQDGKITLYLEPDTP